MKRKILTTTIALLLLVGLVTALPVGTVQAWGCRRKVTYFTGSAEPKTEGSIIPGTPILDFGELVATIGDYELWKGVKIQYHHTWGGSPWVEATFGHGVIVNTVCSLNNLEDGSSLMWGTHVLEFDSGITLTGSVFARRYLDPDAPGGSVTLSRWVSRGDGYKVIWTFDSRNVGSEDRGIIIEL